MTHARWAVEARDDLGALEAYCRPLIPRFADRMVTAALKTADFLADHPRAGPVIGGVVFRKWTLRGSDFILIYRPNPDGVDILRVRNAREDRWGE